MEKIIDNNIDSFKTFLAKSFGLTALGLFVAAVSAFGAVWIVSLNSLLVLILSIAEIALVIFFTSRLYSMSKTTAYICYFVYAILTGVTLSSILIVFDIGNIVAALGSTAMLFGCMAIVGKTTKLDLTKIGNYLVFGLLGVIIASMVNIFVKSSGFDLIISYISIIIFLGLSAYDVQKLGRLYDSSLNDSDLNNKLCIYGAFNLFLDFVNLFLNLLKVFARRSRRN